MSIAFVSFFVVCLLLTLFAGLALLPILRLVNAAFVEHLFRDPRQMAYALGGVAALGAFIGILFNTYSDPSELSAWGRIIGSALHLVVLGDCFILVFFVVLQFWPKGGAVALAAFREGLRQPMFWLLFGLALFLMALIPLLPYFTLGEDYKMVKDLGFDTIVLFSALFAILAAAISVSDEIEGRTAVTLMSKPVSRRQFLLGKFLGILLAALVLTVLLGWVMTWMLWFMDRINPPVPGSELPPDPVWLTTTLRDWAPAGPPNHLLRGVGLWTGETVGLLPGLVISSCQVMVLLSIATALATRLTLVVNVPVCLLVYILGHLAPVLMQVARRKIRLVEFMAQVFDTVLPAFEHFQLGPAIVRDAPLDAGQFALYALNVSLYAVMYTGIALLFGLILFEDRDLA